MPFMGHDKDKQQLIIDTPFIKGECSYAELEKGLWVMSSKMFHKNNVSLSPIYDRFLPSNYYCLIINFTEDDFNSGYFESNNIKIENQSISFIKPKGNYLHCHLKGSFTTLFMVYFDDDWANKYIINSPNVSKTTLELFKNDNKNFVNYKYQNELFSNIVSQFSSSFKNSKKPNFLELKKISYNFLDLFFDNLNSIEGYELKRLHLNENIKIKKIEHFLMSNIYEKFPGIDLISKEFKISPTKLKKDFKSIYNLSIYKYYQSKQMQLAAKYISNGLLIKDIAQKFNYDNASKFSKAFFKYHNILPSQLKK